MIGPEGSGRRHEADARAGPRHAARWFGLDWKTVKRIDFQHLDCTLGSVDLPGVSVIAMDEFAIREGHRYATVVVEREPEARARKFRQGWKRRALRSGLEPLRAFVRRLEPYLPGILACCRWPLSTNPVEGIDNKMKLIVYSVRDDARLFLTIRAAFPGPG